MIQYVDVYITIQRILWLNARLDYEPLFSVLEGVHPNDDDIEEDKGQESTDVKIGQLSLSDLGCEVHAKA